MEVIIHAILPMRLNISGIHEKILFFSKFKQHSLMLSRCTVNTNVFKVSAVTFPNGKDVQNQLHWLDLLIVESDSLSSRPNIFSRYKIIYYLSPELAYYYYYFPKEFTFYFSMN